MDCSIDKPAAGRRADGVFVVVRRMALFGMLLLLAACGSVPRQAGPAQVEARATPDPQPQGSTPQIAAYTPPAQPRTARAQPKRAVSVLMKRADEQRRSGQFDAAGASLERALRIAPDDALLWHRLAAVRLAQRRHGMAAELAAKSNALANSGDRSLRSRNWSLIAQARRGLGDLSGARKAEQRAAQLR